MKSVKELLPWAISTETTLYNKTGSWRNFRPVYENKLPACNNTCPTGEKIQGYLDIINQSTNISKSVESAKPQRSPDYFGMANLRKAWELLTADNPFPAICGRVCFHPCEQSCNRSDYDEPVAIHYVERLIGDAGLNESFKWRLPLLNRKYKIAIIGGGPAGLSCAYHLRRHRYQATIFEADNKLGGLLNQAIPSYRLPQDIVQAEINRIIKSGVIVKLNVRVGRDYALDDIISEYDAVFIGIGAHSERQLNIPNQDHPAVIPAMEFLYALSRKRRINIGKRVGIIGGGNSAMDVARSVLRLGRKPIIIYRRTESEMSAIPDEIQEAKEEGIEFITLAAPERIIIKNNKVTALECLRMKLGAADQSGRRKPIPIKDSNFRIPLDTVIPAIGEEVDMTGLPSSLISEGKRIRVLDDGITTNIAGVFAGGDAVTGPKTVVEALGAGKKAADLIYYYLKRITTQPDIARNPVSFGDLNTAYFEHIPRVQPQKLPLAKRLNSFAEVYQSYTAQQVSQEVSRCFSCGVCNKCDNCFVFCPDMSVLKKKGRYEFNYDYCKGCSVCVVECPRNAITLIEEKR
ncbi:MAG: NAD(P)-binding protein [Planctomycetota bacterium]|nr:NAD(P)-binding protein [Planctomycetota bacterium]MDI6788092.1 NAD(P)-binding protein [Planctomycetota bacterium]